MPSLKSSFDRCVFMLGLFAFSIHYGTYNDTSCADEDLAIILDPKKIFDNKRWYYLKNHFFESTSLENFTSIFNQVFEDKKIAILVSGLFADPSTYIELGRFLKNQEKYDHVFYLSYDFNEQNLFETLTYELKKGLFNIICCDTDLKPPSQVDIFAHSFGGLITRATLENLFSEQKQFILDKCKHVFFFGTPHQGINEHIFQNIAQSLHGTAFQNTTLKALMRFMNLSSQRILNIAEFTDAYAQLVGKTDLLNTLKNTSLSNNYYNIIGTNPNIKLQDLNLLGVILSISNILHTAHQKNNPNIVTDGVVSKESATLIPQGLNPFHEIEVPYDHNALVGVYSGGVPQPIREWITNILNTSSTPKVILVNKFH